MDKYNNFMLIIVIIGALNYGVYSIIGVNLVGIISFGQELIRDCFYFIFGLAGLIILFQKITK